MENLANPGQLFLEKMLERLYSALTTGPLLNCRPHNSRQRICLTELQHLAGPRPDSFLKLLLTEPGQVKLTLAAARTANPAEGRDPKLTLWNKLRTIASDAVAYEKETGAQALFLGYPLLCLPPGSGSGPSSLSTKRIVAPVAFIPVSLRVSNTCPPSLVLDSTGAGSELVIANQALLAWAQQVTGTRTDELFTDEAGAEPWREINEIVSTLCRLLGLPLPAPFVADAPLLAVPKSETDEARGAQILGAGVLGLFPLNNQSLLRDLEALVSGEAVTGPIQAFLDAKSVFSFGVPVEKTASAPSNREVEPAFGTGVNRVVTDVDPCQRRAVLLARTAAALVLHGPPGTGKSQTITNVIADHLALGKRVLFVCDKRTALDVVEARLSALGLGELCAIVHDCRRDEKELYRAIREQIDGLDEATVLPNVGAELDRADAEFKALHTELLNYAKAVSERRGNEEPSFQELLGRYLTIEGSTTQRIEALGPLPLESLALVQQNLAELLTRGTATRYPDNPWARGCGLNLTAYLSQTPELWASKLQALGNAGQALDREPAALLPLLNGPEIPMQLRARRWVSASVTSIVQQNAQAQLAFWVCADGTRRTQAAAEVMGLLPVATSLCQGQVDVGLTNAFAQQPLPSMADLITWSAALAEYQAVGDKWYAGVCFSKEQAARNILSRFGLAVTQQSAVRVSPPSSSYRNSDVGCSIGTQRFSVYHPQYLRIRRFSPFCRRISSSFSYWDSFLADPLLSPLWPALSAYLREPSRYGELLGALEESCRRAERLTSFEQVLSETHLLGAALSFELRQEVIAGRPVALRIEALLQWLGSVEGILRIHEGLWQLPEPLQAIAQGLLAKGVGAEEGVLAVEKAVLESSLEERLAREPVLRALDDSRLKAVQARYTALVKLRQELSLKHVKFYWQKRQRERLLASNGGRLNSAGAEVKRRFVSRGEKAMRLRQAVAVGSGLEGGDPLFDLRPVWLVSPEVTAQVFPRQPLFDLVVFDEASQCRLEEALPVLLRAQRVLIAGDPQQLPPTRFFEAASTNDSELEAEDSQELFEQQQAQTEDLLSAALNLSIEQAYLDVHYRSQSAELIEFSNIHFYGSRLEPLPLHPSRRKPYAPISLLAVDGIYDKRVNLKEADAVVALVKELLSQPTPPSVGIGCFNLAQRDAIVASLDEAALADEVFAEQLETARNRQGAGAFEGLFVKNLENVQGDERDQLIISTTYGPDPTGRFYRRFGPLAQAGGGRRLNVLITRARSKIHLLTSIPRDIYRNLPLLENGAKPNGGWLLLAYIAYAEQLAEAYSTAGTESCEDSSKSSPRRQPSLLLAALSSRVRALGLQVQAPWGNAGLGTDLFVHDGKPGGASRAVLCDLTGYQRATDPVEWEMFREAMLTRQGFNLSRVLSPRIFRDAAGELRRILLG